MEKTDILLIIAGICLASAFWIFYNSFIDINNITIQDNREKPLYESIINRFADTHTYNLTSYNCINYSEDLGFILNNLGYETEQIIINEVNKTNNKVISRHQKILVVLEIEPQTGEIGIKQK